MSILVGILNYQVDGHQTFEDYYYNVYYPSLKILLDNKSREIYNKNETREDTNVRFISAKDMGEENYLGWLSEVKIESDESKGIFITKQFLFSLDEPYGVTVVLTGAEKDFEEKFNEILPYLEKLEIKVLE